MAYNRVQARALCSAAEYQLFEASLADHIKSFDAARLSQKIRRARTLRDKYRDLVRRQRLELRKRTGTKKGTGAGANERTESKARLFAEALERFERRAADLERAANAAAQAQAMAAARAKAREGARAAAAARAKAKAGKPKRRTKRSTAAGKAGFASDTAERSQRQQRLQKTRGKAVQGHVRSTGRRRQARRDARR
jgi:hypothetical protein